MADDAHDERFRQHQELLEGLARLWAAQHALNQEQKEITQRLTLAIESIDQTLAQQAEYNADVRTTLARIETLVARMLPTSENGRDA
jgi:hypothetical protein